MKNFRIATLSFMTAATLALSACGGTPLGSGVAKEAFGDQLTTFEKARLAVGEYKNISGAGECDVLAGKVSANLTRFRTSAEYISLKATNEFKNWQSALEKWHDAGCDDTGPKAGSCSDLQNALVEATKGLESVPAWQGLYNNNNWKAAQDDYKKGMLIKCFENLSL